MIASNLKSLVLSRVFIVLLTVNFLWFECVVSALSTPCIPRSFGFDSTVCVCNSTYCDYATPTPPIRTAQYVTYTSSMGGLRFEQSGGTLVTSAPAPSKTDARGGDNVITITREYSTDQAIMGFGGAFTDAAGINIKSLSNATQYLLMKSYFAPEGIAYSFGRVPIGGCDFSTHGYTYADAPNDPKLEKFNLSKEDFDYKIPLILQANRLRGEPLHLIGTAWSSPAWMKTNNALTGEGELKPQYYQLWAQYLIMFLDQYKKENLNFWALTTGNEPINGDLPSFLPFVPKFNSMGWLPKNAANWIANNLGPTLRASGHNATKILAIDDQRFVLPWWIEEVCIVNFF
uniref:Glucosylceramidase n=1 Tax=Cacopsylla melanoneura TaxID=428564 RepID=A0A8D8U1K1_9HEMI